MATSRPAGCEASKASFISSKLHPSSNAGQQEEAASGWEARKFSQNSTTEKLALLGTVRLLGAGDGLLI